ncbi:MAG: DegV family protein [Peptococcaceae bacterium]|nr:DegV family protein [Peptococcaceae bacterium]
MRWSIVTDSSCDLDLTYDLGDIGFSKVPFSIRFGEKNYIDTEDMDKEAFVDEMIHSPLVGQTACPSPGAWHEKFLEADCIIAITISAKLSGSYNSAQTARTMVLEGHPDKQIYIVDSMSAGAGPALLVLKTAELINQGLEFKDVVDAINKYTQQLHTIFVLSSYDNLAKNGRIPKIAGFLAGKLNLQGIGVGANGEIEVKKKVRGYRQAIAYLINDMKNCDFVDKKVVLSHCQNREVAEKLRDEILQNWSDKQVIILETGGLCSFYAEYKGIIMGYM